MTCANDRHSSSSKRMAKWTNPPICCTSWPSSLSNICIVCSFKLLFQQSKHGQSILLHYSSCSWYYSLSTYWPNAVYPYQESWPKSWWFQETFDSYTLSMSFSQATKNHSVRHYLILRIWTMMTMKTTSTDTWRDAVSALTLNWTCAWNTAEISFVWNVSSGTE